MKTMLLIWDFIAVISKIIVLCYMGYALWNGLYIKSGSIKFYIKPLSRFF